MHSLINSFKSRVERNKTTLRFQLIVMIILGIILFGIILRILFLLPQWIGQHEFEVLSASSYTLDNTILVNADLKMNFSEQAVEALENGIPLTVAVEVKVLRTRPWWRDVTIKASQKNFEFRYHPLTNVHVVKNLASGERYTFNTRQRALDVLGTIRGAQLIETNQLDNNNSYYFQMRSFLDTSRLPAALRQIAALSPAWRLESQWFQWQLK